MADIAMVFHWQPQAFENMTVTELMQWREKARERSETETDWLFDDKAELHHLPLDFGITYCLLAYGRHIKLLTKCGRKLKGFAAALFTEFYYA